MRQSTITAHDLLSVDNVKHKSYNHEISFLLHFSYSFVILLIIGLQRILHAYVPLVICDLLCSRHNKKCKPNINANTTLQVFNHRLI